MDPVNPITLEFSLIGDNDGTSLTEAPVGSADINGNLIGGSVNGVIDPQLGPLADNGGHTETHALLPGNPAIDAGDPNFDPNVSIPPLVNDQRVAARVLGGRIDIGAFEYGETPSLMVTIPENVIDPFDFETSLREAIAYANDLVGADTITFDSTVFATPQTILLNLGELQLTESATINGPGQTLLTIDAQQQSRVFYLGGSINAGHFTLAGLTLTGGQTTADGFTGRGGAIFSLLTNGSLTINQSTITGNGTTGIDADGGGIWAQAVALTGSTVSGNSTTGANSDGGGIFSIAGGPTLTSSTVSENSTAGDFARGGGIYSKDGITLNSSTISGNSTAGSGADGGGIYSFGDGVYFYGDVTLTDSTITGNSTAGSDANGGGIHSFVAVTLTSSTVIGNHAYYSNATGGGIWIDDDTTTIANSIVAGNTAGGDNPDLRPGTGTTDIDFSLIGDNDGTGLVEAQTADANGNLIGSAAGIGIIDPLLGALGNNGGPTETHALLTGSPALDAGDPGIVFDPAKFDQRGAPFVRVFDDPVATGSGIDMGAHERQTLAASFFIVTTATRTHKTYVALSSTAGTPPRASELRFERSEWSARASDTG